MRSSTGPRRGGGAGACWARAKRSTLKVEGVANDGGDRVDRRGQVKGALWGGRIFPRRAVPRLVYVIGAKVPLRWIGAEMEGEIGSEGQRRQAAEAVVGGGEFRRRQKAGDAGGEEIRGGLPVVADVGLDVPVV